MYVGLPSQVSEVSSWVLDFLDNSSVAAFFGAASAYTLVILNEIRKRRQKVKTIRLAVERARRIGLAKLESVRKLRSLHRENLHREHGVLAFDPAGIRALAVEVADKLSVEQATALDAVCHRMQGVDDLLKEVDVLVRELGENLDTKQIERIRSRVDSLYGSTIVNLKVLQQMASAYVAGRYSVIIDGQFLPSEYSEP